MNLELLLEAERRGILPADKAPLLAEARKRGLVGGEAPKQPEKPQADMSFMGRVKDNVIGVDDGVRSYGEIAAAALNKGGESMTMGLLGDEFNAGVDSAVGRGDYDDRLDFYRDQEKELEKENPAIALGADIGGAMVAPLGALGAVGKGAGMLKRMGASAAATGAMSGVYGFAEGEGGLDNRLKDAQTSGATGAAIGAAIPVAGVGIQKVADALGAKRAIKSAAANAPTSEQLRAQGSAAYQAVDDLGVSIKPSAFKKATDGIGADMMDSGLDVIPGPDSLTPKASRLNRIMAEMNEEMATDPTASLPFKSVEQLRRKAGGVARQQDPTDASLGAQAIGGLDDFISNLSPNDIDAGDAKAIGPAIKKARDIWARMSRSQIVDDAIEGSEDYLSGGSSGIRNQFKRILRSDKLNRGFSEPELKAMRRVVNGSIPEQALNLLGGGMGQLAAIGTGVGVGGVPGALIGAGVGAAARKGSEAVSRKNAEIVRAIVANGGLKAIPKANPKYAKITEQLMRQGTAAAPN